MIEIDAPKLPSEWEGEETGYENSPKNFIQKTSNLVLPIKGGWGYSIDDCVIIDKEDSSVDPSKPFKGVPIEYQFVEKRIYAELIIFKDRNSLSSGIRWELLLQTLEAINGRTYDVLNFEVTAFSDEDWEYLRNDWKENEGFEKDPEDLKKHNEENDKRKFFYNTQFWFDITSFHSEAVKGFDKRIASYTPKEGQGKFPKIQDSDFIEDNKDFLE